MAFVVDNSVVIPWFRTEQGTPYTRAVFRRLEREAAHVPALWPFEFVNVLRVFERKGMRAHRLDAAIADAAELDLRVDRDPVKPAALLDLARQAGLSVYDAAYLELAARRGLPLATKDEDMRAAARKLGVALA